MSTIRTALWAAALSVAIAACSGSPTRESTGEFLDDATITAKIKFAFARDDLVKVSDISVDTFKGTVQLTGTAASRAEMDRAAQIAAKVAGVKAVRNQINVQAGSETAAAPQAGTQVGPKADAPAGAQPAAAPSAAQAGGEAATAPAAGK
jgi:hyperosmotically inducible protein